jgi:hypothetical protein
MKLWSWLRRTQADPVCEEEEVAAPVHVLGMQASMPAQSLPTDSLEGFADACRDLQTPLTLQVEDGVGVPVVLTSQNAAAVLEATQRFRELRERDRASLPPVADFGGEAYGSSGEG